MIVDIFSEHYEFDVIRGDDYYIRVSDIVPSELNRCHKHKDIEKALDEYTQNWELVATDSERRRGSDYLWLVNDQYYILCSRSGMESVGNSLHMSKNTPTELKYAVISTVFEEVSKRQFGTIKTEETNERNNITVSTPRGFIIHHVLDEEEQQNYYDDIADVSVELLEKYYSCETIDDIKSLIGWYNEKMNTVFREYVPKEPSILGELFIKEEYTCPNGWETPEDLEINVRDITFDSNYDYKSGNGWMIYIWSGAVYVEQSEEHDTVYEEDYTYETVEELKEILEQEMNKYPNNS